MKRVLTTQSGFVMIVPLAPAVIAEMMCAMSGWSGVSSRTWHGELAASRETLGDIPIRNPRTQPTGRINTNGTPETWVHAVPSAPVCWCWTRALGKLACQGHWKDRRRGEAAVGVAVTAAEPCPFLRDAHCD